MKRLILALAICVSWPGIANAQDGWGWSIIIPSVTQTDVLGSHLRELEDEDEKQAQGAAPAPNAPDASVLHYAPSKQRRTANLAGFVAKSRQADPAAAQALETLFAQGDFIEKIGGQIEPHGFHVDNVADAYTIWWITAWQASRGRNDTPSAPTNKAVQAQAARALSATPNLAGANDAAKQQLAEALLIQAVMLDAAVDQAKGNPTQMKAVSAAAAQGARGMGLDMATMELTEQGFVPARRD